MKSLRQRIIEQQLKKGFNIVSDKPDDYVQAVFMIKGEKKDLQDQTVENNKKYTFRIKKDKLGDVIDFIKSLPGAEIQTPYSQQ